MSLVANVVRSAIAEAASLTVSQPQKDDSLIEIWLVCASAVIVSSPARPPSTPLTALHLAGPIPPRLRAAGACYRCRSAHPTCLVRGNADDGRPVRCCYGGLSHDRFHPPTPWPRSAPSPRTTERKWSGPSKLSSAADRHQCGARHGTAKAAASAVAGTAICNHAVHPYAVHPGSSAAETTASTLSSDSGCRTPAAISVFCFIVIHQACCRPQASEQCVDRGQHNTRLFF